MRGGGGGEGIRGCLFVYVYGMLLSIEACRLEPVCLLPVSCIVISAPLD